MIVLLISLLIILLIALILTGIYFVYWVLTEFYIEKKIEDCPKCHRQPEFCWCPYGVKPEWRY